MLSFSARALVLIDCVVANHDWIRLRAPGLSNSAEFSVTLGAPCWAALPLLRCALDRDGV